MWLSDTAVKRLRPMVAIVLSALSALSLLVCVFGVISFDKIEPSSDLKENK